LQVRMSPNPLTEDTMVRDQEQVPSLIILRFHSNSNSNNLTTDLWNNIDQETTSLSRDHQWLVLVISTLNHVRITMLMLRSLKNLQWDVKCFRILMASLAKHLLQIQSTIKLSMTLEILGGLQKNTEQLHLHKIQVTHPQLSPMHLLRTRAGCLILKW
jgi:hypothetical protein